MDPDLPYGGTPETVSKPAFPLFLPFHAFRLRPKAVFGSSSRFAQKSPFRHRLGMSHNYASSDDFFRDLGWLIEAWCDRRCLHALADVLPAFTSFNGLTDGWGELAAALKAAFLSKDALTDRERQMVAQLRRAAEDAVHRRCSTR